MRSRKRLLPRQVKDVLALHHKKGGYSDIGIFCSRLSKHKSFRKMKDDDGCMTDEENGIIHWAVLAGKKYQGLQHEVRDIHSKKDFSLGALSTEERKK